MTKNSLDALEQTLKEIPPAKIEEPSIQELQLQQEGNDPDAVKKDKKRMETLRAERFADESKHWQIIYELRKEYIPKLFFMIVCWLIAVGVFVFMTGFRFEYFNNPECQIRCVYFSLSDNVLIAFITSTTATVIGIFYIVAKWLFPSPQKEDSK